MHIMSAYSLIRSQFTLLVICTAMAPVFAQGPQATPSIWAPASTQREAKRSEQLRIAEDLQELPTTAGVLLVDGQGHDIISAKIASTVYDTFHAMMLSELDRSGKTTPDMFERINLRLAESATARNELGFETDESWRENATLL